MIVNTQNIVESWCISVGNLIAHIDVHDLKVMDEWLNALF